MPKLKILRDQNQNPYYQFQCPGCDTEHTIDPKRWTFNGNMEKPTFSPSILATSGKYVSGYSDHDFKGIPEKYHFRCHCFIRDGRIQFLNDCSHSLSGQTVDLPDINKPETCNP